MRSILLALSALLLSGSAGAAPPDGLTLPIDCAPGDDCWILRHVDHAPGPDARDYACGPITGDGHKGTDFAIRDLAAMVEGVAVRAAAPGVVDAARDGEPDVSVEDIGRAAVAGRECGNGVRLDHGDGWTTWYCHMRRGSLRVKAGDRVAAGDALGLVGLSGETSFPHLHFDVRRGGRPVDPFLGPADADDCGIGARPLWRDDLRERLAYRRLLLTNAGFATAAPEKEDIRKGYHHASALPASSPALVLWVEGYWLAAGDRVTFRLRAPGGGTVVERTMVMDAAHTRWVGFAGARRPKDGWPAGTYRGAVTLARAEAGSPGRTVLEREVVLRQDRR